MKLALIGRGKMGRAVEGIAAEKGAEIVCSLGGSSTFSEWKKAEDADVWIDFSHPSAVLEHVRRAAEQLKPIVIGTSGWYERLEEARALVGQAGIGALYAHNFSLGMQLFFRLVSAAARLMDSFPQYDVALSEVHHRKKADSPSGTAKALAAILLKEIGRKKRVGLDPESLGEEELQVSSLRVGHVLGNHTLFFDSEEETILLSHRAHSRAAWARGAVDAAEWLLGKRGFFTLDDMIEELVCKECG